MEEIVGILTGLLLLGGGIVSAVEKQKKAAHKPSSPIFTPKNTTADSEVFSAETSPRRTPPDTSSNTSHTAPETIDSEQVTFDPTTDFDLRRAVIESEILTPKYF